MEDYNFFQRHESIKGVKVNGTDRLFLLDFDDKNYHELLEKEFGTFEIAGLYLLINTKKAKREIYVGESTSVKSRNMKEIKNGFPGKMKDFEFDKIILIWDGRPTSTSLFGEDSFRKWLEKYCIRLFKNEDEYNCVNTTKNPKPTNFQIKTKSENFEKDILFLLKTHGLINL